MGIITHRDGRLKTMRLSMAVFLVILGLCWAFHTAGRSKDRLLVRVADVLTPDTEVRVAEQEEPPPELPEQPPEKQMPDWVGADAPAAQAPEHETVPQDSEPPQHLAEASNAPAHGTPAKEAPAVKAAELPPPQPSHTFQSSPESPDNVPAPLPETAGREAPAVSAGIGEGGAVELEAADYRQIYAHWLKSGAELDEDATLVPLRILDLEHEFRLFQMKAVAVKNSNPFVDLTDNSRVAPAALSSYSSTCFVVNRPWHKWGDALSRAGLRKGDDVQVRYYTYDFVRSAIYARAMKAFAWSLSRAGLPSDTPPGQADVLGRVYGVKQAGGGAFGVFLPVQVDFRSGRTVTVDPVACFGGEPDVLALNRAGLL